jgi:hypothetical protein
MSNQTMRMKLSNLLEKYQLKEKKKKKKHERWWYN